MTLLHSGFKVSTLLVVLSLTTLSEASEAVISPGDLVATAYDSWVVFHPGGARETILSANGEFPSDVTAAPDGNLLLLAVARNDAGGTLYSLSGGTAQVLSSGGAFSSPAALAVGSDGAIFVADQYAFGFQGAIFEINRVTGAQREVLRGYQPRAVVVLDDSTLAVGAYTGTAENTLLLVNRVDGSVRESFFQVGFDPERLAIGADGNLWAADYARLYHVTIHPSFSVTPYQGPEHIYGISVDVDGAVLVGTSHRERFEVGAILRFDPATSQFGNYLSGDLIPIQVWGMARVTSGPTAAHPTTWGRVKSQYR